MAHELLQLGIHQGFVAGFYGKLALVLHNLFGLAPPLLDLQTGGGLGGVESGNEYKVRGQQKAGGR